MPFMVPAKCVGPINRPEADGLQDGIYALRASYQGVHYRMLYFFSGKAVFVISHGFTKERTVPSKEIDEVLDQRVQIRFVPVKKWKVA